MELARQNPHFLNECILRLGVNSVNLDFDLSHRLNVFTALDCCNLTAIKVNRKLSWPFRRSTTAEVYYLAKNWFEFLEDCGGGAVLRGTHSVGRSASTKIKFASENRLVTRHFVKRLECVLCRTSTTLRDVFEVPLCARRLDISAHDQVEN